MKPALNLRQKKLLLLIPFLSVILIYGCGSGEKLVSTWPSAPIQIDGISKDWEGSLQTFPNEQYSVGIKNDDKYLYICFITSDRSKINKIMTSGLNVLFNYPDDERRDYTITFPVTSPDVMNEPMGPGIGNNMRNEGSPMQKEGEGMPLGDMSARFQQILDRQLNFNLKEKDFTNSLSVKNNEGIELKMRIDKELLVYEMKVPLMSAKSSFPVGAMPGEKINVKMDIAQMKMPAGKPGAQTGERQGGIDMAGGDEMQGQPPGARGRQGGVRGRMQNAQFAKANNQFSVEFTIQLVKNAGKN